jgi:DNA modification methylase
MGAVLAEIGYADALLAREDENGILRLIDGHLRAGATPDTEVPVLILDVDEAEADKILATLDPLAGMAEADLDALKDLVSGIDFDVPEFGALLQEISPGPGEFAVEGEDVAPDPPEVPVSRRGDLWVLGSHRLLCGDATSERDVATLLGSVKPNLLVSDPPYGVEYRPGWRSEALKDGAKRREGEVSNDDRGDWTEAWRLYPGAVAYVWHASLLGGVVGESLERCGFELRSQIIWAKNRFALSRGHYHWQHEACLYAVRKGQSGNWRGDRSQTTLWSIAPLDGDEARNNHGTQKPVEAMRRPILNHTDIGQSVCDFFVGSGTTIIAAETTKRICYAMELDPVYVDVAVRRWQDFTGKPAILDGDGRDFAAIERSRTLDPGTAGDFELGRQRIARNAEEVP